MWNLQSDRPIYFQLVEQIQLLVVSGVYPAGSRLPSVRELAAEASVNPNTMQRALAQLESDGLLYTQRTSGRFVTEDSEKIAQIKKNFAVKLIREFIDKMHRLGYDGKQTVSLVSNSVTEGEKIEK